MNFRSSEVAWVRKIESWVFERLEDQNILNYLLKTIFIRMLFFKVICSKQSSSNIISFELFVQNYFDQILFLLNYLFEPIFIQILFLLSYLFTTIFIWILFPLKGWSSVRHWNRSQLYLWSTIKRQILERLWKLMMCFIHDYKMSKPTAHCQVNL